MRAIIGTILTAFFGLLTVLGITVDNPEGIIEGINAGVTALLTLVTLIVAAWGRIRALTGSLFAKKQTPEQ